MPHEMPSIDSAGPEPVVVEAVTRLADDLAQDGQAHHISNRSASTGGSSAARRAGYVDVTTPTDDEHAERQQSRRPRQQHARESLRHRREIDQLAQAEREQHPAAAAQHRQEESLEEELPLDVAGRRAERLADADLARPLLDGDEHDVHDADAAERRASRCRRW